VVAGDTLWRIAHEHRISVEELRELNDLTGDLIHVRDELRVPAREGAAAPPAPAAPMEPVEAFPSEPPLIDDAGETDAPAASGVEGAGISEKDEPVAEDQIY